MRHTEIAKLSVPSRSFVIAWVLRHWQGHLVRIVVLLRWRPVVHHVLWSRISGLILVATIVIVHHLKAVFSLLRVRFLEKFDFVSRIQF